MAREWTGRHNGGRRCPVQGGGNDPLRTSGQTLTKGAHSMGKTRRVGIQELVSRAFIATPLRLICTYQGRELEARVTTDGAVAFQGERYPSLSAAAVAAIKSARPDGRGSAINGWQFWRYIDEQGNTAKVDVLRRRLADIGGGTGNPNGCRTP